MLQVEVVIMMLYSNSRISVRINGIETEEFVGSIGAQQLSVRTV